MAEQLHHWLVGVGCEHLHLPPVVGDSHDSVVRVSAHAERVHDISLILLRDTAQGNVLKLQHSDSIQRNKVEVVWQVLQMQRLDVLRQFVQFYSLRVIDEH